MKITKTSLEGCIVIEPDIHGDDRGFFLETYQYQKYKNEAGIDLNFVQDNYSRSEQNVLRGLHFQEKKPQGKLVRVVKGEVFDVAVDIRENSKTYGQWESVILNEENKKQFWVPPGFAHGFVVLSSVADFEYKCSDYYDPLDEGCIIWNDPQLDIKWPIDSPILSLKDSQAKKLS
jgi:dTDP-4-dehydrorhamnose 3,5-epimerase